MWKKQIIQNLRKSYQNLYTKLSPLQKVQFSESESESSTRSKSFAEMDGKQKAAMIEREDALITCIITKHAFNKDVEYKVETDAHGKGTIMLIDSNTGRRKVASKYTNGIQEAIEAKEQYMEQDSPTAKKRYDILLKFN